MFRGNNPRDAYFGTGGAATPGWAEFAALYNSARTRASSIKVRFVNDSSAEQVECIVVPSQDSAPGQDFDSVQGQTNAGSTRVVDVKGSGKSIVFYRRYASTSSVYGISKLMANSEEGYAQLTSGDPSGEWYWHVATRDIAQTNSTSIRFNVEIIYYVEFYDRKVYEN